MNPVEYREHVGSQIRELRLRRNYTQQAVAEDLGIAHNTISTWENGSRAIDIDSLYKLAAYFEINVTELVDHISSAEKGSVTHK